MICERWPVIYSNTEYELLRMVAIVEATDEELTIEEWNKRLRR